MSSSDAEPAFDIDSQLAQTISNIGGNQTIHYGDRTRAARIVTTTHSVLEAVHVGGVETPYTQYLASGWPVAIGLLVGGLVVNRFARIIIGR